MRVREIRETRNIGLIALRDDLYPILVKEVTSYRVKEHFKGICKGEVEGLNYQNWRSEFSSA
jgi:hypothetical protein